MKIIIVGAGISGLSTYLFLKKLLPHPPNPRAPHEITIYESYSCPRPKDLGENGQPPPGTTIKGAGLGVAPNGMRALRALDSSIHDEILCQGYPVTKGLMKASNGMTLGALKSYTVLGDGETDVEATVLSSRQGIWDALCRHVPDEDIQSGMQIVAATAGKEGSGPSISLENEQHVYADLILGCDGVKSIVKHAVLGDGKTDDYPPHYEGLMGVGGFVPSSYMTSFSGGKMGSSDAQLTLTLGAHGFFGYGPSTSLTSEKLSKNQAASDIALPYGPTCMWWSSYESDTVHEFIQNADKSKVAAQLVERHGDWQDPTISMIVKNIENLDITLVPSWTTPKLPKWHSHGLVLIGDAAHALPSTSAQGVSMCLEDAFAFSLILARHLDIAYNKEDHADVETLYESSVEHAAITFTQIRKPRVEMILDRARQMAGSKKKKSFIGEWIAYGFIWFFGWLGLMNSWNTQLYNYNVEVEVRQFLRSS